MFQTTKKTHRLVNEPQISGKSLSDYMAASDVKRRSIITTCKFQPVARVVQHNDAKLQVGRFLRGDIPDIGGLLDEVNRLRERIADGDFERDVLDHNADYLQRFADVAGRLALPDAQCTAPGPCPAIEIQGVRVTADLVARFRRSTSTNKVKTGAAIVRYAKGQELKIEIAEWQSAFIFGYLKQLEDPDQGAPDQKLCFTIDAYSGTVTAAPGNTPTRMKNIEAACAGIAERWDNIQPPPNAVF